MSESRDHAALLELFRQEPELALWLARRFGRVTLPAEHTSSSTDPLLKAVNLAPDVTVLVRDVADKLVLAMPVEVQRGLDPDKEYTLPCYVWLTRERFRCPTRVLVIATRDDIAERLRRPIRNGPGNVTRVIVLGPRDVPRITDLAAARANPALAVLSAAMHARSANGPPVARAAVEALTSLPGAHVRIYSPLVFGKLSQHAIHEILEDIMQQHQQRPDEEDGIGYEATMEILLDLRKRCEQEGRRKGQAEGLVEGLARGEAEGKAAEALRSRADLLLRLLERRGLEVDEAAVKRIQECRSRARLDQWFDRAIEASRISQVFVPPKRR